MAAEIRDVCSVDYDGDDGEDLRNGGVAYDDSGDRPWQELDGELGKVLNSSDDQQVLRSGPYSLTTLR